MKFKNNSMMSERGSIRYVDGSFYSSRFTLVFVPMTNQEYSNFCNDVEMKEAALDRRLTEKELADIAGSFGWVRA